MKKLLVILGPTATGKTDLGISLAKKFKGELVACDSRQVYRGLDIGTGKLPGEAKSVEKGDGYWAVDGVIIWLYDVVNPKNQYSLFNYVDDATRVIDDITENHKLPIIVGGTGLYLRGVVDGLTDIGIPIDYGLREELGELSIKELQEKLNTLSPTTFKTLNNSEKNNKRRLIRKIEQVSMYGYTNKSQKSKVKSQNYDVLKIGLTAPRSYLNQLIDQRVISRIKLGMIDEAINLESGGVSTERMKQLGLEYGVLANYMENKITRDQLVKLLQIKIHQYAKRQITWFKKEKDVEWFDITEKDWIKRVEKTVSNWYNA